MAKTTLQVRAEKCVAKFNEHLRKPIVIEFAGLPKSGKTTTLNQVYSFLKRCGFRVKIVVERASVCPILDKKHANFNVWTACTTLAQILEHTQTPQRPDDPDILFLDRGLFDSVCWLSTMERLQRIRSADRKAVEEFLLLHDWRARINGVILMTAKAKDALSREQGCLPVEGLGGSIMNSKVLRTMKRVLDDTSTRLCSHFRIYQINTSSKAYDGQQKKSCADVAAKVIEWIEQELQEDILVLPKTKIARAFGTRQTVAGSAAKAVAELFCSDGSYLARDAAENNTSKVQALPVVIVRNRKGDILRLRRKEKKEDNALHKRIVIWAGGHVRREDSENGNPLLHCAVRELEEELRLSVEPTALQLRGAIHSKVSDGTTKHVAIVYEWYAETDDVEIALSNAEFFERLGNSLSGTFMSAEALLKEYEEDEVTEDWSVQIVKNFLKETSSKAKRDLFDAADKS